MLYVLVFTFLTGASHLPERTLRCPDWRCVEKRIASAQKESRAVHRIRVFKGEPGLLMSGNSVFPPVLDYWLN